MVTYSVSCLDLQTKGEEIRNIYDELVAAMPNNTIEGIQRALFVFQPFCSDEVAKAYSVLAYFHSNGTSPGAMRFQREGKEWSKAQAKTKLRSKLSKLERDRKTSPLVKRALEIEQNEDGEYQVVITTCPKPEVPRHIEEHEKIHEIFSLEKYFESLGAFPISTKKRTKIMKRS